MCIRDRSGATQANMSVKRMLFLGAVFGGIQVLMAVSYTHLGNDVEVYRIRDALHGYFALGIKHYRVEESFKLINRFLRKC